MLLRMLPLAKLKTLKPSSGGERLGRRSWREVE